MEGHRGVIAIARTEDETAWASVARGACSAQWDFMGAPNGRSVEGIAATVSSVSNMSSALSAVEPHGRLCPRASGISRRFGSTRKVGFVRVFYRRFLQRSQKRGNCVGPTKRGKGTKIMAIADGAGLPLAIDVASASPAEVRLVETTIEKRFTRTIPRRLIGDKAYDSDPLDQRLRRHHVALIAPHKINRCRPQTQDGRVLRRYQRRWKIERLFAWLHQFRRVVVRYEYHALNYLGLLQLACVVILLRNYL